jgi:hypothetical protein
MPTIFVERGFRVMIFLNDHPPAHVHVLKAGEKVRVTLSPVELIDSTMKLSDTRRAIEIVENNIERLRAEWDRIHWSDNE